MHQTPFDIALTISNGRDFLARTPFGANDLRSERIWRYVRLGV